MKVLKRLLTLCALVVGMGGIPSVMAADADAPAAKPALKGDAICTRCHDESENRPILSLYQTRHGNRGDARAPNCQSCHGESKNHLGGNVGGKGRPSPDVIFGGKKSTAGYAPAAPQVQSEACLSCHKSGLRAHWEGSQHESRDIACANCHRVHISRDPIMSKTTQPEVCYTCHKEQRAQASRMSHHPINEGKVTCSDCHNPHGSTGPKLLVKNTLNETCFTCHAEKRGPLLWEHTPVTDGCDNCHTPHGSTNTPLLKARAPYLCQECHTNEHASSLRQSGVTISLQGAVTNNLGQQQPGGINPSAFATGVACLNCHVQVHGSNHPAGSKLNR